MNMILRLFLVLLCTALMQKNFAQNKQDSLLCKQMEERVLYYFKKLKTDSAILYAQKNITCIEKTYGKNNLSYADGLFVLAFIYDYKKNYTAAEPLLKEALQIVKNTKGTQYSTYIQYLEKLIDVCYNLKKYNEAISLAKELVEIYKKAKGTGNVDYIGAIHRLAFLYDRANDYENAETFYKEELAIVRRMNLTSDPIYLLRLYEFTIFYLDFGEYANAKPLFDEIISIIDKAPSSTDRTIIKLSNEYINITKTAEWYSNKSKYIAAEMLYKIALAFQKKEGTATANYSYVLNKLAGIYYEMGKYNIAEQTYKEILAVVKQTQGVGLNYAINLNNLAEMYRMIGRYPDAEPLYYEAINIIQTKTPEGKEHSEYGAFINNLALLYRDIGNYTNAEPLFKEAIQIAKKTKGAEHNHYAASLNNLGTLYFLMGNYAGAETLYIESYNIRKKKINTDAVSYTISLMSLGNLYRSMSNYTDAEKYLNEAVTIRKKVLGEEHPDYAESLNDLAGLYEDMGDDAYATDLYKEALAIRKKVFGEESPAYAVSLNNLAALYERTKNYAAAEPLYKQSMATRKKIYGTESRAYAIALNNLAALYANMGNYVSAEPLYKESLAIRKKLYGAESIDYTNALNNLSILYYQANQLPKWKEVIHTTIQTENTSSQTLLQNFSEAEKETYLSNNEYMFKIYLSMLHHFGYEKTNNFYQTTTAKQGWLLQGKQLLNSYAANSANPTVQTLLAQWENTNSLYGRAIQLSKNVQEQYGLNEDSLFKQTQTLEKQLIAALPELQAVIKSTGFTAKDVTAKLTTNEAVVQWISFKYYSPKQWTDTVLYAAFIITKKDTTPTFVTVFTEKQLQQLLKNYHGATGRSTFKKQENKNAVKTDVALYNLIWKPLLPYLKSTTTIYNLPAGLLHKVSFAAITDSNTQKQLIDMYELHQLLSISELIHPLKGSATAKKSIVLMGGANYDAVVNTTTSTNTAAVQPMYRNVANDNSNIRFNYLEGTKTEIETVNNQIKSTAWKVQNFVGITATEDNFKQLSGSHAPRILHIATHGFYFPPKKEKLMTNVNDDENNDTKDFPLLRSGIVLTGANNYWGKDTLLNGKEDGIVTAQEISHLNLLNTELVVLSACQTALGDINGSEGVYGLQRAFKMAGVKKLLISLWEVPDAETAELMQLFYSNVFKGDSYYTAFRKAQKALKEKYKDPTKWAGFVLFGE
ncbi:MAG: CHAT domain-containing protein [Chitinophagaceae bacterium]|nr:CHAT domain-containing protein [Chitinophagaceae bacterium]MCW5905251.1 CHAT domain-containing protein [Chitinophagaceae bacterium]